MFHTSRFEHISLIVIIFVDRISVPLSSHLFLSPSTLGIMQSSAPAQQYERLKCAVVFAARYIIAFKELSRAPYKSLATSTCFRRVSSRSVNHPYCFPFPLLHAAGQHELLVHPAFPIILTLSFPHLVRRAHFGGQTLDLPNMFKL